ncbi:NAD regulator [bacterium]|nr:NAD regulator [bacterium]
MTSAPIVVGLSAVIVAVDEKAPYALTTQQDSTAVGLPHGRFDPTGHRTFELGLRDWVRAQTGFELGYVEQLYTFGDRGRELPQADLEDAPGDARLISVGYLGLTPERTDISGFDAVWRDWYRFFPWEDHREGRPKELDVVMTPALMRWAATDPSRQNEREGRIRLALGIDGAPWVEERSLERFELLYEAGLAAEAGRLDAAGNAPAPGLAGEPMISDHRRILATAIGRLRGKIKYRPVVFELTPERFTLFQLQRIVESILGQRLHKQNFRRALDRSGLVVGLGSQVTSTGGRPAELHRFRREAKLEIAMTGVQTPRA